MFFEMQRNRMPKMTLVEEFFIIEPKPILNSIHVSVVFIGEKHFYMQKN